MPLHYSLARARDLVLETSWTPPTVDELLELLRSAERRFVSSAAELQNVILEQLREMQAWLVGENPQAFALWNVTKAPGRPKEENSLSDWYCHGLRLLLAAQGVIVNREVEVRRSPGAAAGQRQDIRVEVRHPKTGELWAVVIEVKGCWNAGLRKDLQGQLAGRYLQQGGLTHGIYLVTCFPPNQISVETTRKKLARHTVASLERDLQSDAAEVDPRMCVVPVVHQAPLPPQHLDPNR
jgi:hypothetical protein